MMTISDFQFPTSDFATSRIVKALTLARGTPNMSQPAIGNRQSAMRKGFTFAQRGFTFVEVLFAIIILGIGMIMLAAMLPVAISQTAQTRDQITARGALEGGYSYVRAVTRTNPAAFPVTNTDAGLNLNTSGGPNSFGPSIAVLDEFLDPNSTGFPYSTSGTVTAPNTRAGRVVPLIFATAEQTQNTVPYPRAKQSLQTLQGSRIDSANPTVQWLAFYRRDQGSNLLDMTFLALRLQNAEAVQTFSDATLKNEAINAGNGPFLVQVEIEDRAGEPDVLKFVQTGTNTIDRQIAASGAYVIIAHSPPPGDQDTDDLRRPYRNNGRVFRLAARRDDLDSTAGGARIWELDPAYDLSSAGAGADGVLNTPDDIPDGSMNTANHFETGPTADPARATANHEFDGAAGTTAWAWIVGRGLFNPSEPYSATDNRYTGVAQDIGVLKVKLQLD